MDISFPRHISWQIFFKDSNPYSPFGKQTASRIKKTAQILENAGYTFIIEPVTDLYLDAFIPLYEAHIGSKERGVIFPVKDRVADGRKRGREYHGLSLYKKDTYIGGLIFSINPGTHTISGNYKFFPHEIPEKIPISVAFVAELYFYEYGLKHNFTYILHGVDRNVYGFHSAIGLACYKTQIGGRPFIPLKHTPTDTANEIFDHVPAFDEDMLVFLGNTHEEFAVESLLVSEKPVDTLKAKFPILFSNKYYTTHVVTHNEILSKPNWK